MDPSYRPTYTPEQIQLYYERIQLPQRYRNSPEESKAKANTEDGFEFLTVLQKHPLCAIPFENLELHYSFHHTVTLDMDHLFEKIVTRNAGRGGYCMENSGLFGTVMRTLGFDIFSTRDSVNEAAQHSASRKDFTVPRYGGL